MSAKMQQCRVCGCTSEEACNTPHGPCFWVSEDLCSGCVPVDADGKLQLLPEDLAALESAPMVKLQMNPPQALMLMSALQLALRHPNYEGPSRPFVTQVAAGLAQRVGVTPRLLHLALSGFVHECDRPVEAKSDLILPGDPGFGL